MTVKSRTVRTSLRAPLIPLVLLLAGLLSVLPNSIAVADGERITWSVEPADPEGPDTRRWIEQTLDPGQTVTEHLVVRNFGRSEVTFRLTAADGYLTEKGHFNMLPADAESVAAGTWIDLPETVTVGPEDSEVVEFTVAVPENATPGDHAAGVAASIQVGESGVAGNKVGVESRIGFRVMTRVTGELRPELEISDFQLNSRTNWNPFQPGSLTADITVRNSGNVLLDLNGEIANGAKSWPLSAASGAADAALLPGQELRFTANMKQIWPTGPQEWQVHISGASEDEAQATKAAAENSLWFWPLPQILALIGGALIVLGLLGQRRNRKQQLDAMLARAREEGRAQAQQHLEVSTEENSDKND